jgi:hypothetical protein
MTSLHSISGVSYRVDSQQPEQLTQDGHGDPASVYSKALNPWLQCREPDLAHPSYAGRVTFLLPAHVREAFELSYFSTPQFISRIITIDGFR